MHLHFTTTTAVTLWIGLMLSQASVADDSLVNAVTLVATFDDHVRADRGGGSLTLRTRTDHPTRRGEYIFEDGFDPSVFRIAKGKGIAGGALQCLDVLPRRGRIFFPAAKNLAFDRTGWSGAVSFWLNTDPNKLLKTPYCDPIQITEKGAHNGGIWVDFPDVKPRDMRMGVFRGLAASEKPLLESDPRAPIVRLPRVPFLSGQWHHIVLSWNHFDTGKPDAVAQLYVDRRLVGELQDREIAMRWDVQQAGIYVAVNYIGLLDQLIVFNRSLTTEEISRLYRIPAWTGTN